MGREGGREARSGFSPPKDTHKEFQTEFPENRRKFWLLERPRKIMGKKMDDREREQSKEKKD